MKKIFAVLAALAIGIGALHAQKLILGERTPEFKVKEWGAGSPPEGNARLIQFVNAAGVDTRVADALAGRFRGRMDVILVTRDNKEKAVSALAPADRAYYVALDEGGKIFAAFDVQFVPYGVLTDAKGKVLWFGNPSQLDDRMIAKYLK